MKYSTVPLYYYIRNLLSYLFDGKYFTVYRPPPPLPSVKIGEAPLLRFLLRGGSGGCTQATNSWWFATKRRGRVARHREKLKTVLLGSFIKPCTRSRQEVNFQEVTFRRPWHKIGDYPKKADVKSVKIPSWNEIWAAGLRLAKSTNKVVIKKIKQILFRLSVLREQGEVS